MKRVDGLIALVLVLWSTVMYAQFTGKPIYEIEVHCADTVMGKIVVELFPAIAPNHVRNWDSLVAVKFYDSLAIHRVVPDWVIQGGDPNTRNGPKSTWGLGSDDQTTVDAEFSAVSHQPGILSQARASDPNSGTSQFFICLADNSELDRKYSVYGQVTSGMDVVRTIENVDVDNRDIPLQKVVMFITKTGSNDAETATPEHAMPFRDTAISATTQVMFRWHPVADAMMYRLQVAKDTAFTDITHDTTISQMDTNIRLRNFESFQQYHWRMMATNGGKLSAFSSPWSFYNGLLSVENERKDILTIDRIAPHPVADDATIHFTLREPAPVTVSIVDMLGRPVRNLVSAQQWPSGPHEVKLDAATIAGGVYMLVLQTNTETITKQFMIE